MNLRKHPLLILFAIMFFAFSLLVAVAVYLSSSSSASSRRSRKKVNKYRLPANGSGFRPAALGPELSMVDAPVLRTAQAAATGVTMKSWQTILLHAVLIVIGASVSVLITMLLTQTLFP